MSYSYLKKEGENTLDIIDRTAIGRNEHVRIHYYEELNGDQVVSVAIVHNQTEHERYTSCATIGKKTSVKSYYYPAK